jgi:transposase
MDEGKRQRRTRRSFTEEFKAQAIRLVLDEGKTVMQVARELDLTASAGRQPGLPLAAVAAGSLNPLPQ